MTTVQSESSHRHPSIRTHFPPGRTTQIHIRDWDYGINEVILGYKEVTSPIPVFDRLQEFNYVRQVNQ